MGGHRTFLSGINALNIMHLAAGLAVIDEMAVVQGVRFERTDH
jgi:hypothetical protein